MILKPSDDDNTTEEKNVTEGRPHFNFLVLNFSIELISNPKITGFLGPF